MRRIEELLNEVYGSRSELARTLGVEPANVTKALKRNMTPRLKRKYTNAFNRCFETNYSIKGLFEES